MKTPISIPVLRFWRRVLRRFVSQRLKQTSCQSGKARKNKAMERCSGINLPDGQKLREKDRHLPVFASERRDGCVNFDRDQVPAGLNACPNRLIERKF
jgi:hypothetical protein